MQQRIVIELTRQDIDRVFAVRDIARWEKNLDVYDFLLGELKTAHTIPEYERKFNYFYQVRRNAEWRKKFYTIFYDARTSKVKFADILAQLFKETNKIEASFASKLAATLNPALPIIDRHVLSYIGQKLPSASKSANERMEMIVELHNAMQREFGTFLSGKTGSYLLKSFDEEYPGRNVSDMKKLDFVLWQSGGKKNA